MGTAIGKDHKVTKDQALSAVADAFDQLPRGGLATIEEIVKAGCTNFAKTPTRLDRWKTTSSDMHQWTMKPHHQHGSPRPQATTPRTNALVSSGRLMATNPQQSVGTGGITWKTAIESGTLTRNERMAKVRMMFDSLDQDDNHVVTWDEFLNTMTAEGISEPEARSLFREMDDSHTGRLTIAKFDHYVAVRTLSIVRSSFKSIDASHDRQISQKEFKMYFLGNGLSKKQVRSLWDAMDKNRNGKINFVEYRDWARDMLETTSLDQVATSLGMSVG